MRDSVRLWSGLIGALLMGIFVADCACNIGGNNAVLTEQDPEDVEAPFCDGTDFIDAAMALAPSEGKEINAILFVKGRCGLPIELTHSSISVSESEDGVNWNERDFQFNIVEDDNIAVNAAMTMDYSGSMRYVLGDLESAVTSFIDLMKKYDRGEIIKFSTVTEVVQPFTADKGLLRQAVADPWNDSLHSTALYDSLGTALDDAIGEKFPRVVVAFTDGNNEVEPSLQDYSLDGVIDTAQTFGVPIFAVGLGYFDTQILQEIAGETGGFFYTTPSPDDLGAIYRLIASTLDGAIHLTWNPGDYEVGTTVHIRVGIRTVDDEGNLLEDEVSGRYVL